MKKMFLKQLVLINLFITIYIVLLRITQNYNSSNNSITLVKIKKYLKNKTV